MKPISLAAVLTLAAVCAISTPSWGQAAPAAAAPTTPRAAESMAKTKIDAVTVYRGQALVTRTVDLPAGQGLVEFVVSELPEHVLAGSIFAEGADGVEVRSVRYRERAVAQDIREEVRKLDDQIQANNDKLAAIQKRQQVLNEERLYLEKLANFAAPTATAEMTKGVLNADQLKTLTNFQFETRKTIADEELKLQGDQRTTQEQANLLARQKAEIAGRSSRTLRESVILINRERAGGSLRLRYLVDSATWSPSYNVRADIEKKSATLEYQASIQQTSGEDWNDVAMTLSTATPNLVAAAPALNQLEIALASPAAGGRGGGGGGFGGDGAIMTLDNTMVQSQMLRLRDNVESARAVNGGNVGVANFSDTVIEQQRAQYVANDKALNRVADQIQVLELLTRDSKAEIGKKGPVGEAVVVNYKMQARTSLPSRVDRQLVRIDQLPMQSKFFKVAVPVLTSYVYDQAELTNSSSLVLLAGPVSSYVDGQFVGSGTIDTVAVGQPFTVGFGIDASLRATRERTEKTEQTQGGNRIVNYTYRIALENFGTKAVDIRLMDRIPTGKDTDVRVTFDDADNVQISKDRDYQQADRKKGILRWDVQVPAQKNGSDAFALSYKMHLEHDRNLAISTAGLLGPELKELLNF